jgi:PAS domain S-box-containing protein
MDMTLRTRRLAGQPASGRHGGRASPTLVPGRDVDLGRRIGSNRVVPSPTQTTTADRGPLLRRAGSGRRLLDRLPRASTVGSQVLAGLVLAMLASLVKALLNRAFDSDVAFLPLFAAVPIATPIGGRRAGLVLVVVGALVDTLVFHAPIGSLIVDDPAAFARLILFVPIATSLVLLIGDVEADRRSAAESALRLEALVDSLPDATFLLDATGATVVYANPAAAALGHAPGDVVGTPIAALIPELADPTVLGEAARAPVLVATVGPDGSDLPTEVSARAAILPDGEPGLLLTIRDVRARVDSEIQLLRLARAERAQAEALSTIIGSLDEGAALFDDDGALVVTNDAMTRMADGPLAGRSDVPAAWWEAGSDPILTGEPPRWLQIARHDLAEVGGHGDLLLVADITQAMEANAARDAFVGVMSHELRTPVTTILTAAHLLDRGTAGVDAAGLAADIRSEAERLNELIEDLLVLSRSQVGAVTFEPEPVLVQHALAKVVDAERGRYPNVTFTLDIHGRLPPVDGDRTFVGQVLRNLIGNAGKYSPDGRSEVTVSARAEGDEVVVRVLDQGPGFAPEDAPRLFDIFFRAESTSRRRAGSGIGLYVSRTLVEAMGGRIWAARRPTGGAEFGFALRAAGSDDDDDQPAATLPAEGGEHARRAP